jgi:hypothetical protein
VHGCSGGSVSLITSAAALITINMLLKSCATPPASWPIDFIRSL